MKRNFTCLISLISLIFSTLLYAEPAKFTIDSNHSYVMWSIGHLGFSTQTGKWFVTGELIVDPQAPEQSKVEASIDVANFVTGLPELDEHLKDSMFFDVARYPKATFVSNKITGIGKNTGDISGILTLRGVSKPVVLHATFNKEGINPVTHKMTIGFSAVTTIKRSDFGMTALLPSLSDTVDITIAIEAYQDKKEI